VGVLLKDKLARIPIILYSKFFSECAGERISKIGQYLIKLDIKYCRLLFWTGCICKWLYHYAVLWNKLAICVQLTPSSSKRSPGYRLLAARNVTRPQSQFHDKIDNSDRPFVPKIVTKPNALRPLAGAVGIFSAHMLKQCLVMSNEWWLNPFSAILPSYLVMRYLVAVCPYNEYTRHESHSSNA